MYKSRVFCNFFSHTADVSKHIKISTVWGHYHLYFRKQRHSDRVLTVNKGHLFGGWGWDPGMGEQQLFLERAGVLVTPAPVSLQAFPALLWPLPRNQPPPLPEVKIPSQ